MDGTTATTLAPSEDEMSQARALFERMANTVVEASALRRSVEELAKDVLMLRTELEKLRDTNRWMDQQITELRASRDQALRDKQAALDELNVARKALEEANAHANNQRDELARLNANLRNAMRERDDVIMEGLNAAEEVKELRAKLAVVAEAVCPPVAKTTGPANDNEREGWADATRDVQRTTSSDI